MKRKGIRRFSFIVLMVLALFIGSSGTAKAGTSDWGYYLDHDAGMIGIQATISTMSSVSITQGNPARNVTIYGPTILPPGDSCLEVSTIAYRYPGMSSTVHQLGAFDSCNGRFAWTVMQMDSTWKSKYESNITYPSLRGGSNITDKMSIVAVTRSSPPPANCWGAYVWNFLTLAWDTIASNKCGTDDRAYTEGWALFETYGYDTASSIDMCGNLGNTGLVQMRDLKFYWSGATFPSLINMTDHAGDVQDNNGCFGTNEWKWVQNDGDVSGGYSFYVCDEARYIQCEE